MFLKISHKTECRYSRAVQFARIEYRVFPVTTQEQNVLRLDVSIDPPCPWSDATDAWGNVYRKAEWESIAGWSLMVDIHVETLMTNPFNFPPAAARRSVTAGLTEWPADVRGYLRWEYDPWDNDPAIENWVVRESGAVDGAFLKIQTLMHRIHQEFKFCKGQTDVKTPPGEILRLKLGVCQDFATLLIAAARSMGLPARYVSGYIYEGPKARRRETAPVGHGWAEVYFPDIGWRGFDPLNGILTCHTHVRVAQGRWYADAAPTVGRFIGLGIDQTTRTEINVDVADSSGKSMEDAP